MSARGIRVSGLVRERQASIVGLAFNFASALNEQRVRVRYREGKN